MGKQEFIDTVFKQTMGENGFVSKLRENVVDEDGYKSLLDAVHSLIPIYENVETIDKLLVACLYEVPWEIENCVDHYSSKDTKLGKRVSQMGENLRGAINKLLWNGLEKYYEKL